MRDLDRAKEILASEGMTCVLCCGDRRIDSEARGVAPLVKLIESDACFEGWSAADKVVGRATAFLYVLLGVHELYAGVVSRGALGVLRNAGINIEYGELAEHIVNRTGDGICPFEAAVQGTSDPDEAYLIIRNKMRLMGIEA